MPDSQSTAAPGTELFRREGDFWTVTFAGRTLRLRDGKGMRYLALLLTHPERRVAVGDLAQGLLEPSAAAAESQSGQPEREAERLRTAVGKRIRAAIAHVEKHDPALGHYLRATIHTGYRCYHHGDPGRPVRWLG